MAFLYYAIVAGVIVAVVLSVYLIHRYWPYKKRQEHNDVARFIFAAVAVLYAVIMAFVVIVGWETLASARNITYSEADQAASV